MENDLLRKALLGFAINIFSFKVVAHAREKWCVLFQGKGVVPLEGSCNSFEMPTVFTNCDKTYSCKLHGKSKTMTLTKDPCKGSSPAVPSQIVMPINSKEAPKNSKATVEYFAPVGESATSIIYFKGKGEQQDSPQVPLNLPDSFKTHSLKPLPANSIRIDDLENCHP